MDVSDTAHLGESDAYKAVEAAASLRPFPDKASGFGSSDTGRVFYRQPSLESEEGDNGCKSKQKLRGQISVTGLGSKSARSKLFEICAANYWKPPSFLCCKEEGKSHLRMYTYRVTVTVEAARKTVLECFSEPKNRKKSAQEHAAEGVLWYLKHMGYLS